MVGIPSRMPPVCTAGHPHSVCTTARNMSVTPCGRGRTRGAFASRSFSPGEPQQNAYIERFKRTVRYDSLARQLFDTIADAQDAAT